MLLSDVNRYRNHLLTWSGIEGIVASCEFCNLDIAIDSAKFSIWRWAVWYSKLDCRLCVFLAGNLDSVLWCDSPIPVSKFFMLPNLNISSAKWSGRWNLIIFIWQPTWRFKVVLYLSNKNGMKNFNRFTILNDMSSWLQNDSNISINSITSIKLAVLPSPNCSSILNWPSLEFNTIR